MHEGGGPDNAAKIDVVYHGLAGHEEKPPAGRTVQLSSHQLGAMLGAYRQADFDDASFAQLLTNYVAPCLSVGQAGLPLRHKLEFGSIDIRPNSKYAWFCRSYTQNYLGVRYIEPTHNWAWEQFEPLRRAYPPAGAVALPRECAEQALGVFPLKPEMVAQIYNVARRLALNNPFAPGTVASPGRPEWSASFAFYLEIIKRSGLAFDLLDLANFVAPAGIQATATALNNVQVNPNPRKGEDLDVTCQFLSTNGAAGCVNNALHLFPSNLIRQLGIDQQYENLMSTSLGKRMAHRLILTYELLQVLLSVYSFAGKTQTLLDHFREQFANPSAQFGAVERAALRGMEQTTADNLVFSINITNFLIPLIRQFAADRDMKLVSLADGAALSRAGITTVPMYTASTSHLFHPRAFGNTPEAKQFSRELYDMSLATDGHLNLNILTRLTGVIGAAPLNVYTDLHPWIDNYDTATGSPAPRVSDNFDFFDVLYSRTKYDADTYMPGLPALFATTGYLSTGPVLLGSLMYEADIFQAYDASRVAGRAAGERVVSKMTSEQVNITIDLNQYFDEEPPAPLDPAAPHKEDVLKASDVEIVVIRPNIEHNMLGVIMGLGGDDLGNTLWGQTELSVYDDSMHGIWGMSYKYHERAIVFNEKNLIRMWDIAYDGYNGGKDDTYVDWTAEESAPNGPGTFKEETINLGKNYRGPSMMVMAFAHDKSRRDEARGTNLFDEHFKRNWPSPIVFYDSHDPSRGEQQGRNEALPLDYDNLQNVNVDGFRVFNNGLYAGAYAQYRSMMPDFRTLHVTRKTAGQGSADSETSTDCLAFQGSMKVKENGMLIQEIHGSGHHGPDYTGVASVRAGKGQKTAGQAPTLHRLI
jgi:hypothetical protein